MTQVNEEKLIVALVIVVEKGQQHIHINNIYIITKAQISFP